MQLSVPRSYHVKTISLSLISPSVRSKLSVATACHVKTISSSLSYQRRMKLNVTRVYHVKTNHRHFPINEVRSSVLQGRVTLTPHHHNHSFHPLPHRPDGRTYVPPTCSYSHVATAVCVCVWRCSLSSNSNPEGIITHYAKRFYF